MILRMIKTAVIYLTVLTSKSAFSMNIIQLDLQNISNNTNLFPGCRNITSDVWCNTVWAPANQLKLNSLNETQLLTCYKDQDCNTDTLLGLFIGELFIGITGAVLDFCVVQKINHKLLKKVLIIVGNTLFATGLLGAISGFTYMASLGEKTDARPPIAFPIQKVTTYAAISGCLTGCVVTFFYYCYQERAERRRNRVVLPATIAMGAGVH